MTIHVLVEGPSERVLLQRWSPRLLGEHRVKVHPHQGKGDLPTDLRASPDRKRRGLLDQLPAILRGFGAALDPNTDRVVVLVDADNDNVAELRRRIKSAVSQVARDLPVRVHIAVEETEAFYLGDLKALQRAFPKADLKRARDYKPDSICGTWELFGEIVSDGGGNKVAWAEAIGPILTTKARESRSPSFRELLNGLLELVKDRQVKKVTRRPYRHPPRSRRDSSKRR